MIDDGFGNSVSIKSPSGRRRAIACAYLFGIPVVIQFAEKIVKVSEIDISLAADQKAAQFNSADTTSHPAKHG